MPQPTLAQTLRAEGVDLAKDFKDYYDIDTLTSRLDYKLSLAKAGNLTGLSGSDHESGGSYDSYGDIWLKQKTRHFCLRHRRPSPSTSSISDVVINHEEIHFDNRKRKSSTVDHYPEEVRATLNKHLDNDKVIGGRFKNRRRFDPDPPSDS